MKWQIVQVMFVQCCDEVEWWGLTTRCDNRADKPVIKLYGNSGQLGRGSSADKFISCTLFQSRDNWIKTIFPKIPIPKKCLVSFSCILCFKNLGPFFFCKELKRKRLREEFKDEQWRHSWLLWAREEKFLTLLLVTTCFTSVLSSVSVLSQVISFVQVNNRRNLSLSFPLKHRPTYNL